MEYRSLSAVILKEALVKLKDHVPKKKKEEEDDDDNNNNKYSATKTLI
jgi:hypothetical protein